MQKRPDTIAVIPARMDSSRFPGKPLAPIFGKPMIHHCYDICVEALGSEAVYISSPDEVIKDFADSIGAKFVFTSHDHERAVERVSETVEILERLAQEEIKNVILFQGDEPTLVAEDVANMQVQLERNSTSVVNAVFATQDIRLIKSKDTVKAVLSQTDHILFLSRSVIPSEYNRTLIDYFIQTGLIGLERSVLSDFIQLRPGRYEISESVDINRLLESGHNVVAIKTQGTSVSVDRPDDITLAEACIRARAME